MIKSILVFTLYIVTSFSAQAAAPEPPSIILKLDDVRPMSGDTFMAPRWMKVAEFLKERNLKSSFGIICQDLEGEKSEFVAWCKQAHQSGLIEFWNHGYIHKKIDYKGKTLGVFESGHEIQLDYFTRSQKLAEEKLGFVFHSFGSPYNAINQDTAKVIATDPNLKVWLYGSQAYAQNADFKGIVLERTLALEKPTHNPNYEAFVESFENENPRDLLVLQGHPNSWDDARWNAFVKIIDFLQSKGCSFITPMEWYNQR